MFGSTDALYTDHCTYTGIEEPDGCPNSSEVLWNVLISFARKGVMVPI
jgi:hypothetical protein